MTEMVSIEKQSVICQMVNFLKVVIPTNCQKLLKCARKIRFQVINLNTIPQLMIGGKAKFLEFIDIYLCLAKVFEICLL